MWEDRGGKRAYLRHLYYLAVTSVGFFDSYDATGAIGVSRFVFVCKGNICRSPYTEIRARSIGLPAFSAGLDADNGQPADERFSRTARSFGVDLSTHRARNIADLEVTPGDLLIAFEPRQALELRRRYAAPDGPFVTLLGLFGSPRAPYVHDPYGASDEYARWCVLRIERALTTLASRFTHIERPTE